MTDIPGDTSTTSTIAPGDTILGTLDVDGDHDWYAISLSEGEQVRIRLSGYGATPVPDTYLNLRDSSGVPILSDDDSGGNHNSVMFFIAPSAGTYYVDACSYLDLYAGDYQLSVEEIVPVPDVPGDASTTSTISPGDTVLSTLDVENDHDWYAVSLTEGQQILIRLSGSGAVPVEDTFVALYDSSGNFIIGDDDSGTGFNSALFFTPATTGTYYIDATSLGGSYTGEYQLSVEIPIGSSYDQIADQLVNGFYGGNWHHWDTTQGGSITVNLTALTGAEQTLARTALAEWTDIIGVGFSEVLTGGQIVFSDSDSGAYTAADFSDHVISSALVNISTDWVATYGTDLYSYSFQTYLHEIGHALGLGHGGNYNGSASYPDDALFLNDAWSTTIMSYFDQTENAFLAGQGFTETFVLTPMEADIVAMQTLYGLSATTRVGDTTYGFGSNAGRAVFDASIYPSAAFTIFDDGGNDTLDYHATSADQRIELSPEAFSNVMGLVGNVMIARGVTIENAIGGGGGDALIGNDAANLLVGNSGSDSLLGNGGNDTLDGGLGNDTLGGGAGLDAFLFGSGDGQDVITDFAAGDLLKVDGYGSAQSITQVGADVLLVLSGSDQVTFRSTDVATVQGGLQFSFEPPVNLIGTPGNDTLVGGPGNDRLEGAAGNDTLDGGAGADVMIGGTGNDIFYVDDAGDIVNEGRRGGTDEVRASVSYALATGMQVEKLTAAGGGALNLTGNELAQTLTGNDANNVLYGMAGNDTLRGGGGNDTLRGGAGTDTLMGGDGLDAFVFEQGGGNDKVSDFVSGVDKIDLHLLGIDASAIRTSLSRAGNLVVGVDADHNGRPDFTITLIGVNHVETTDFIFA